MAAIATPWGRALLVEELEIPQQAGDRAFASLVQLLQNDAGEHLVRFAYTSGGVARRGPVTMRPVDIEALRAGLRDRRELARALGMRPR
jgi:hypothetical protein